MSREDEARQELLRMIERDLAREDEEEGGEAEHPLVREARRRGLDLTPIDLTHIVSPDEATDYVKGRLCNDRQEELRLHVAECPRCKVLVDRKIRELEELDHYFEQRARERGYTAKQPGIWVRLRPALALAGGFAAVALCWWLLRPHPLPVRPTYTHIPRPIPKDTIVQRLAVAYDGPLVFRAQKDGKVNLEPALAISTESVAILTQSRAWPELVLRTHNAVSPLAGPDDSEPELRVSKPLDDVLTNSPNFAWALLASVYAETYRIHYWRVDPVTQQALSEGETVPILDGKTNFTLNRLLPPGEYRWQVRAKLKGLRDSECPVSLPARFIVLAPTMKHSEAALGASYVRLGRLDEAKKHFQTFRALQEKQRNQFGVALADQWLRKTSSIASSSMERP